jgi:pimeloyl-ACP methyl ester carboxylesterase
MPERIQHTYVTLPAHNKSFALLSEAAQDNVKRAVVFIHGFNGSARGTWTDFQSLVDDPGSASSWWELADLYFFHYQWDSVFQQLTNNALKIYKFIESVYPKPGIIGRAYAYRKESFRYEELVLVGHSEGGLILRKVILQAAERDKTIKTFMWDSRYREMPQPAVSGMLRAKMRLFAPALGGDMQSGFVGILVSLPVISNFLSSSAAKKGMNPSSQQVLAARDQTKEYAQRLIFDCFRAHVIWAEKDTIISSEKYADDSQCLNPPQGTNHSSVCKPSLSFTLPLDFVEEGVDRHECK